MIKQAKFEESLSLVTSQNKFFKYPTVICDEKNPEKFIEINSRKEVSDKGPYISSKFDVNNNGVLQKCDEFKHGKFIRHHTFKGEHTSEKGAEHWNNIIREMKEKGEFSDDVLVFDHKKDFQKYKENPELDINDLSFNKQKAKTNAEQYVQKDMQYEQTRQGKIDVSSEQVNQDKESASPVSDIDDNINLSRMPLINYNNSYKPSKILPNINIFSRKPTQIPMMYGQDGSLRTSVVYDKTVKKDVKSFNKQLNKFDKDFINYASMDISSANINNKNTKYILGKLDIGNSYMNNLSSAEMSNSMGYETAIIAGSKFGTNLGVKAKIAEFFQPLAEKMAEKHPSWQKVSDNVAKAANNGRLPLTADSAAVMKMAFDKRYYNDCRKPDVDIAILKEQYELACGNLKAMALSDGVSEKSLSDSLNKKIYNQMRIDNSMTDIYKGMATGDIRLAKDAPVLDKNNKEVKVKGQVLYRKSERFVDADGKNLNCFDLQVREPQSMSEIISDYQKNLEALSKKCNSEADYKKLLASPSYQYIEHNAKTFAMADCPCDAAEFNHDFSRANIESCKNWAVSKNLGQPYESIEVPLDYKTITNGNSFAARYSIDDYDDMPNINQNAREDIASMSDDKDLGNSLKSDMVTESKTLSDINKIKTEIAELEALKLQEQMRAEELTDLIARRDELKTEVSDLQNINNKSAEILADKKSVSPEIIAPVAPEIIAPVAPELPTQLAVNPEIVTSVENVESVVEKSNKRDLTKAIFPTKLLVNDITIESLAMKAKSIVQGISIDELKAKSEKNLPVVEAHALKAIETKDEPIAEPIAEHNTPALSILNKELDVKSDVDANKVITESVSYDIIKPDVISEKDIIKPSARYVNTFENDYDVTKNQNEHELKG